MPEIRINGGMFSFIGWWAKISAPSWLSTRMIKYLDQS